MEIDHIGYLTKDIKASIKQFQNIGYCMKSSIIQDVSDNNYIGRDVAVCFLCNVGYCIELVQPLSLHAAVSQTLKRQGEGPYHICYRTNDLSRTVSEMFSAGYFIVQEPLKAVAFGGASVAFLYKKNVGLIELLEMKNEGDKNEGKY